MSASLIGDEKYEYRTKTYCSRSICIYSSPTKPSSTTTVWNFLLTGERFPAVRKHLQSI